MPGKIKVQELCEDWFWGSDGKIKMKENVANVCLNEKAFYHTYHTFTLTYEKAFYHTSQRSPVEIKVLVCYKLLLADNM